MAVQVLEAKHDGTKGTVTLRSDNENFPLAIQELQNGATRNMAIEAAAKEGLPDPRCEIAVQPYAVDPEGEPVTRPREQKIDHYRVDVPVTRRLV